VLNKIENISLWYSWVFSVILGGLGLYGLLSGNLTRALLDTSAYADFKEMAKLLGIAWLALAFTVYFSVFHVVRTYRMRYVPRDR